MSLLTTNINYSGKDVNLILQECFSSSLFQTKFGARLVESIKSKYFYWDISNNYELQAYQACPTVGFDDVTLNQNSKDLCEFMVIGKIAHNALIATAREIYYRKGVLNEKIMQDSVLFEAILDNIIKTIRTQWDNIILNGDTAGGTGTYLDLCDGFITQWNADADVVDVPGVLANFTVANIITEMNKIINAVPDCLAYNADPSKKVKIGVSVQMARLYEQYLQQTAGFTGLASNPSMPGTFMFMGYDVIPLHYLPSNTAFATYSDNLMLVTDDATDFANLRVVDKSLTSTCDEVEIKMGARGGMAYGYGTDIVLYQAV